MTAQTSGTGAGSGADRPPATEQAKHAAGTAADEGKHVAGVAGEEAKNLASEAKGQARDLAGELRSQVSDQSRSQRDRLVEALRQFTDELDSMAESGGGSGMATELVRQVSTRAKDLTSMVENKEPASLVDDVRGVARRRSGTFLLGALAAGVLAGRMTKGARAQTQPSYGSGTQELSAGYPATGTAYPATGTAYPAAGTTTGTGYGTTDPGYGTTGAGYGTTGTDYAGGPAGMDPVEPGLPPTVPNDDLNNRGGNP